MAWRIVRIGQLPRASLDLFHSDLVCYRCYGCYGCYKQEYMKTRVCSLGPFLLWVSVTAEFRDYIIFGADLRREMA